MRVVRSKQELMKLEKDRERQQQIEETKRQNEKLQDLAMQLYRDCINEPEDPRWTNADAAAWSIRTAEVFFEAWNNKE